MNHLIPMTDTPIPATSATAAEQPTAIDLDSGPAQLTRDAAGSKAATLARLRARGLAVPAGLLLPRATTRRLLDGAPADPALLGWVEAQLARLGGERWAVRSSALAEDTADASYAGQYLTVLGVATPAAALEAIRDCARSGAADHARAYASATGGDAALEQDACIPVLLMPLVDAVAAGVAFSTDPVSGDARTVVAAVPGLGDKLVDGRETPDEWSVSRQLQPTLEHRAHEGVEVIDGARAVEVAQLCARVAAELGCEVDIEWALDRAGALVLLQARPITALPTPQPHSWGPGIWSKDVAHYPVQMTPFGVSVAVPETEAAAPRMAREWGLVLQRLDHVVVGGEIYTRAVPIGPEPSDNNAGAAPPPALVMGLLARLVPAMRARMATARKRLRAGHLQSVPARWWAEWKPEMQAAIAALLAVEPAELDAAALRAHIDQAQRTFQRGGVLHFELVIPYIVHVHEFVRACEAHLGMTTLEALEVLRGGSPTSSESARELAALGERVRASAAALAVLQSPDDKLVERLRAVDSGLADDVARWRKAYGFRTNNYDPGAPTLNEQPALFASLLRSAGADTTRADAFGGEALQALRARLGSLSAPARKAVEDALEPALAHYGLREDNSLLCDTLALGMLRRALCAVGPKLVAAGVLAHEDDSSWLRIEEVREALDRLAAGAAPGDLRAVVRERRAHYAYQAAHPGPLTIGGTPGPMPDVRHFPLEGRRVNGAVMWMLSHEYAAPLEASAGDGLVGLAGSAGAHRGRVRVVHNETRLVELQAGEVLVCPVTTPAWSPAFAVAGALVTDHGSVLSHAAIVARENGLPAVVGTVHATTRLRDGMDVTVDGSTGRVTIHAEA